MYIYIYIYINESAMQETGQFEGDFRSKGFGESKVSKFGDKPNTPRNWINVYIHVYIFYIYIYTYR